MNSNKFFNPQGNYVKRNKYVDFMDDTAFLKLHWTEQLKLRPLNPTKTTIRPVYERGDSDTRLDNWEVDDEPQSN